MNEHKIKINQTLLNTSSPPVDEIITLSQKQNPNFPILDLSQAVPSAPPPLPLQKALSHASLKPEMYSYGPILGTTRLRKMIASRWSSIYHSDITIDDVGVTSGCNQAFCAAISSLATKGDSVILASPWYFNHKMWLDMQGINVITLPCTKGMIPDLNFLKKIHNKSVKAIVLVSPNNPTGLEYPRKLIKKIADFVQRNEISLVIDETYRDFISHSDKLHNLFQISDWRQWLVHLYSFSKVYRIPGQRVGAIVASQYRLKQIIKFVDTMAICPNQLGQEAAIFGLTHLTSFVEDQRLEVIQRKKILKKAMKRLPKWEILSIGAYFAYLKYPIPIPSIKFTELLFKEASVRVMPGSFFVNSTKHNRNRDRNIRLAFANVEQHSLVELVDRLKLFESIFYEKYCV